MVDTDQMKKVIVIGCPGAGKSTFSRKLVAKTGLPLYYLDMIWHRPDRTTVTREEFDERLSEIISRDEWVLFSFSIYRLKHVLPVPKAVWVKIGLICHGPKMNLMRSFVSGSLISLSNNSP